MERKRNIYIMYGISLLQGMIFYGPIATLYRQAAGVSVFQITIIESISLALCLCFELPWGIIADKIGYKKTMVFCSVLYFLSKIVFWRAEGFWWFLAERLMLSVIIAGLSGVDISVLYLSCGKKDSQKVFGIYNNLNTVGLLMAAFVYSMWIKNDYRLSGFLTVITYGIAMVLALGLAEVKEERREHDHSSAAQFLHLLKDVLRKPQYLLFLAGIALLNETHQTVTVFLNQLQYVRSGLNNEMIGFIYVGVTLIGLVGVLSSKLTRLFGEGRFAAGLFVAGIVACITLAVTRSAFLSVAAIVLLRISFSLFGPLQTELQNRQITTGDRATALSINAVLIDCVGIGTNLCFGKLADVNLTYAFIFGAASCTFGLVFFCIWWYYKKAVENVTLHAGGGQKM